MKHLAYLLVGLLIIGIVIGMIYLSFAYPEVAGIIILSLVVIGGSYPLGRAIIEIMKE